MNGKSKEEGKKYRFIVFLCIFKFVSVLTKHNCASASDSDVFVVVEYLPAGSNRCEENEHWAGII